MPIAVRLNTTVLEARMVKLGIDDFAKLGKRMGVERSVVSRVLRGERDAKPSFAVALADALDLPLEAIIAPDADTVAAIESAA